MYRTSCINHLVTLVSTVQVADILTTILKRESFDDSLTKTPLQARAVPSAFIRNPLPLVRKTSHS